MPGLPRAIGSVVERLRAGVEIGDVVSSSCACCELPSLGSALVTMSFRVGGSCFVEFFRFTDRSRFITLSFLRLFPPTK